MLLLLRSAVGGAVTANLGIAFGLAAVPGTTANLGIQMGLAAPTSVELNIFNTQDLHFGLTSIPVGFLTRSANVDAHLDLIATGGFGEHAAFGIQMGLAGTVGSSFTSAANLGIAMGLTGALASSNTAIQGLKLDLSGAPTISGGTLTPTANLGFTLGLVAGPVALGSQANLDMTFALQSAPSTSVLNLATEMRLSFSADEIRLFFRKG